MEGLQQGEPLPQEPAGGGPSGSAAEGGAGEAAAGAPAGVPIPVACRRFGVAPYVLRGLLDEYPDWLPLVDGGNGRERLLAPDAVERLGDILRWRREGLSPDEIRSRLAAPSAGPADPLAALLERLAHLQAELSRSEERRVQDRDRMMMALVRTQQEIQHLRYELAGARTRKGRRRGFWRRLFGS